MDVGLCVPFTALGGHASKAAAGSGILVCAQNMHQDAEGPYTGEVSAPMLLELGVTGVVLGHSERRQFYGETDRALQEKVPAALAAGLRADPLRGRERGRARARARPSGGCATRCRRGSSAWPSRTSRGW